MAIRICFAGREYQRLELMAVAPQVAWHVHSDGCCGDHEIRSFDGLPNNYSAALAYAEERAMHRPKGDIWLVDDPTFSPVRYGMFEPNEGSTDLASA